MPSTWSCPQQRPPCQSGPLSWLPGVTSIQATLRSPLPGQLPDPARRRPLPTSVCLAGCEGGWDLALLSPPWGLLGAGVPGPGVDPYGGWEGRCWSVQGACPYPSVCGLTRSAVRVFYCERLPGGAGDTLPISQVEVTWVALALLALLRAPPGGSPTRRSCSRETPAE